MSKETRMCMCGKRMVVSHSGGLFGGWCFVLGVGGFFKD